MKMLPVILNSVHQINSRRSSGHQAKIGPASASQPLRSPSVLKELGFEVKMKSGNSADGEIYIYGDIGNSFWTQGVTSNEFADQLKQLKGAKNIDLRIDSDGGDVFQAETMYSLLRAHSARITAYIDGHAASAASFLAMAADEIVISEAAFLMIHNASGGIQGSSTLMRAYADLIDRVSEKISQIYVARTNQKIEQVREWMAVNEGFGTWFDAEQAIEFGFADRVTENLRVAANVRHPDWFPNLPSALRPNVIRANAAFARIAAVKI
jgi:ATP-dependent Clp protease protease subunit